MANVTGMQYLEKDLYKYYENYMRSLSTIIGKELEESAKDAIEEFYKDYPHPRSYHRHYYNLREKSFRRYYSNKHGGNTYVTGVLFTPETMDDIYAACKNESISSGTSQVLNSVLNGFHGLPYDVSKKRNGSPKKDPVGFGFYNFDGDLKHTGSIGLPALAIPRMNPTPLELVQKKRDYILDHMDEYSSRAEQKAKQYKYVMIN